MDGYGFPGWTREEYEAWMNDQLDAVSSTRDDTGECDDSCGLHIDHTGKCAPK